MNTEIITSAPKYRAYCLVESKIFPVTQIDFKNQLITVDEGDNTITDTFDMFILMQFTGVLDINNNEIYQGDKVTFGKYKTEFTVMYKNDGFICISDEGDEFGLYTHRLHPIHSNKDFTPVLVGNIYNQ